MSWSSIRPRGGLLEPEARKRDGPNLVKDHVYESKALKRPTGRPVSRVLFRANSAAAVISLAGRLPGRSSGLPESHHGPDTARLRRLPFPNLASRLARKRCAPPKPAPLFGLAPGRLCRASLS